MRTRTAALRRTSLVTTLMVALAGGLVGCRSSSDATAEAKDAKSASTQEAPLANGLKRPVGTDPGGVGAGTPLAPKPGHQLAAFAGGCFWGVEETFRQVPGVTATAVGYTGGHTKDPTYESVCSHTTGHAEAALVEFDPAKVSYDHLLEIFFETHDPTTLNRQGPDVGDQYRSEVFTFDEAQASAARAAIARAEKNLAAEGSKKHVVTRVGPLGAFYKAEGYHQQYDEKTGKRSCPLPAKFRGT